MRIRACVTGKPLIKSKYNVNVTIIVSIILLQIPQKIDMCFVHKSLVLSNHIVYCCLLHNRITKMDVIERKNQEKYFAQR